MNFVFAINESEVLGKLVQHISFCGRY